MSPIHSNENHGLSQTKSDPDIPEDFVPQFFQLGNTALYKNDRLSLDLTVVNAPEDERKKESLNTYVLALNSGIAQFGSPQNHIVIETDRFDLLIEAIENIKEQRLEFVAVAERLTDQITAHICKALPGSDMETSQIGDINDPLNLILLHFSKPAITIMAEAGSGKIRKATNEIGEILRKKEAYNLAKIDSYVWAEEITYEVNCAFRNYIPKQYVKDFDILNDNLQQFLAEYIELLDQSPVSTVGFS